MDGYISTVELPSAPWQAAQAVALVWPALASPQWVLLKSTSSEAVLIGPLSGSGVNVVCANAAAATTTAVARADTARTRAWRMLKLRMDRAGGGPPASPGLPTAFPRTVNAAVQQNGRSGRRHGRAAPQHAILGTCHCSSNAPVTTFRPTTCGSCRPTKGLKWPSPAAPTPASPARSTR